MANISRTPSTNLHVNPVYSNFKKGIDHGAAFSARLDTLKLVNKTCEVASKALKLIPSIAAHIPFNIIDPFLKDTKRFIYLCLSFRTIKFYMENPRKAPWTIQVMNVACIGLSFFTIIDILDRLKVDVKVIHTTFKKVPFFGVLPFAGLLNLSIVTLNSMIFLRALDKHKALKIKQNKLKNQIVQNDLTTFKDFVIAKVKKYQDASLTDTSAKTQAKFTKWTNVQAIPTDYDLAAYSAERTKCLESKLQKTQLDQNSTWLTLLSSVMKVSAVVVSTFVILSGFGLAVVAGITVAMGIIEVSCDITNYFLKKKVSQFQVEPNPLPALFAKPVMVVPAWYSRYFRPFNGAPAVGA